MNPDRMYTVAYSDVPRPVKLLASKKLHKKTMASVVDVDRLKNHIKKGLAKKLLAALTDSGYIKIESFVHPKSGATTFVAKIFVTDPDKAQDLLDSDYVKRASEAYEEDTRWEDPNLEKAA